MNVKDCEGCKDLIKGLDVCKLGLLPVKRIQECPKARLERMKTALLKNMEGHK